VKLLAYRIFDPAGANSKSQAKPAGPVSKANVTTPPDLTPPLACGVNTP
jgi:hypothetical protein